MRISIFGMMCAGALGLMSTFALASEDDAELFDR